MTEPEPLPIPCRLRAAAVREGRDDWFVGLAETVPMLADRWGLTLGRPYEPGGHTAWVAPARSRDHGDVALKVMWRHPEADREADGLRVWNGAGTVRLHASLELPDTLALLIERCDPGTPLGHRPASEQDRVVAALLRRLGCELPADHPFPTLQTMCDRWADQFDGHAAIGAVSLDVGTARDGVALFRSLPATADRHVLLCTDLHAGNVLAAAREPWLAIDPKPHVGDPTYDALQHLLNSDDRLHADPRGLVATFAHLAGIDVDRLALWLFARCVIESVDHPDLADVARRLAPR